MVYVTTTKSFENKNANVLPPQYHDFKNAFKKKNANILPQHQPNECAIELREGTNHHLNMSTTSLRTN
jgi:hypothetical protein